MQTSLASSQLSVAIIGAGMAGLSCAAELKALGHQVTLFDKGRGPGGRMSTRRVETPAGTASFDHGASSFIASERCFRKQVHDWQHAGVVQPWSMAGSDAWVGVPSMNSVIRHMAADHNVFFNCHIRGLARQAQGWCVMGDTTSLGPYDAVVLAIPMEQASAIVALHDLAMARACSGARAEPCWTGMFAFAEPLDTQTKMVRNCGDVALAYCNSAKPGREGPESWVVHASHEWSQRHLEEDKEDICQILLAAFAQTMRIDLPKPVCAMAHRWRYAHYSGLKEGPALWNPRLRIGLCGDWLLGGGVQEAWLSGRAAARQLAGQPVAEALAG